ncbi:MAG: prepilin-type N-terminal cleavage/methylation domain-containing protein [Pseudomonadota bacterium]
MTARPCRPALPAGFTLVEMIVVIAIAGIIAAMVAVFIRSPVQGYIDTARRAQLTEAADTALRRLARDVRAALPNSVRVGAVGGNTFLEFIPTIGGGRYRQFQTAAGGGDVLDFNTADGGFDVTGPVPVYGNTDSIVIYNLGPASAADAYSGNNRGAVTSANPAGGLFSSDAAPHTVTFGATNFPSPSPGARFHLVQTPVSYECAPDAANPATGVLRRYAGYNFSAAQPTPPPTPPATSNVLVAGVAECAIAYDPNVTRTRTGLVTIWLRLEAQGESARLVHQIHVHNQP